MPQPHKSVDLCQFNRVFEAVCYVLGIPHHDLGPAMKMLIKDHFERWLAENYGKTVNQLGHLEFDKNAELFANAKACEFLYPYASLKRQLWDHHRNLADDVVEKAAIDAFLERFFAWENHTTTPDQSHAHRVRDAKLVLYYALMFEASPELEPDEKPYRHIYRLMRADTKAESDDELRKKCLRPILRKLSEWADDGCIISRRVRETICKRPGRQMRKPYGEIHE